MTDVSDEYWVASRIRLLINGIGPWNVVPIVTQYLRVHNPKGFLNWTTAGDREVLPRFGGAESVCSHGSQRPRTLWATGLRAEHSSAVSQRVVKMSVPSATMRCWLYCSALICVGRNWWARRWARFRSAKIILAVVDLITQNHNQSAFIA